MPIWGPVALLCRAIDAEGRQEADQILSRARADAAGVIAAARNAADRDYQRERLAAQREAHAEAKRRVDSAELEARKRIMAFREKIIQEVLGVLDQRLQACRKTPDYPAFLRRALKEGLDHLPGREFVVELDEAEAGLLQADIEERTKDGSVTIDLKAVPDCRGGLRITTRDRRLCVDNSLAARRLRSEDEIRREIWRVIGTPSTTA